jgi:hypothetical protein
MVTMRLALALLSKLSSWNVVVQMYFSLLLAALTVLGLWLIYRRVTGTNGLWGFVAVAWLFFSLGQYENMLYGIQLVFYFMVLGAVWAIYLLSVESTRATLLAACCGFVASFSINSGLLVWPIGLFVLLVQRAKAPRFVIWSVSAILCVFLYYTDYAPVTYHPSPLLALRSPLDTLIFAFATLGSPLSGGNPTVAVIAGIGLSLCVLLLAYRKLRGPVKLVSSDALVWGIILLALLSAGAIAVGRVTFGLEFALTSRYTTLTTLAVIGLYFALLSGRNEVFPRLPRTLPLLAFLCVVGIGLAFTNLYGWRMSKQWHYEQVKNKYILQTFESQPDQVLSRLFPLLDKVHQYVPFLKQAQLSAFQDPVDMLLLLNQEGGAPTAAILPEHPVIQQYTCGVQTLRDFSVAVAAPVNPGNDHINILLGEGDREIVSTTVPIAAIRQIDWVSIRMRQPIRDCIGKSLSIVISSDAVQGSAAVAWTYPSYYPGNLTQGRDGAIAGRSLGLEVNTLVYGLR